MSKNLIVLFIIILLIVGGFGIYSYDQANQAKKEVEEKNIKLESNNELVSELKENIQEKEKQIDELKASLPREEKDLFIARLKEEIENSSEKIKELNFTITELKDKLAKQEGAINQQDLVKRVNQLIIEKENIQKNVDAYEIMIEKLKNEKIELEQKLAEEESKPIYYYVTKEDSLWKIAERFYNQGEEWIRIFEANMEKIKNPDLIYPYQRFTIPKE
ncbi:MAG: LysM peptidoglycan-binding domain-containing protein [Candidatus Atribacteria bacterium]